MNLPRRASLMVKGGQRMREHSGIKEPGSGRDEPVAVVGAACRFPGEVRSLASLGRLLMARRDTVREVPPERWEQAELAGLPAQVAARLRHGCFLDDDVCAYDPEFFGINAQEAPWVDPEITTPFGSTTSSASKWAPAAL